MTTPGGSTVSVLVADDDPLVRRVLRMAFESQGYRVHEAGDATEARALALRGVDLVVLDMNMPGGTVHETLDVLRQQRPNLPVLVLSGETHPPDDLHTPVTDFARKPIELDDLLSRVHQLLERAAGGPRA